MGKRVGGRTQHFKNAAQLHELKLDRAYRNRQLAIMGQDFWRSERERDSAAKAALSAESTGKQEAAPEAPRKALSWESYIEELRRKHESVSDA
jgi:hypothetical protein